MIPLTSPTIPQKPFMLVEPIQLEGNKTRPFFPLNYETTIIAVEKIRSHLRARDMTWKLQQKAEERT